MGSVSGDCMKTKKEDEALEDALKVRDEMVKFQEMTIYDGMTLMELDDKIKRMNELMIEFHEKFIVLHKEIQKNKQS